MTSHDRRRFLQGALAGIATTPLVPFAGGVSRTRAVPRTTGRVAIVGAGLAGLACAHALAARGITATVFEGSTRVGGRCFSLSGLFPGHTSSFYEQGFLEGAVLSGQRAAVEVYRLLRK